MARALQGAVDGGDRGVEALCGLFGGEANDLREEERRPLLRRQMLEGGDEREADALPQHRGLRGVGVRREHARVRDRLKPVRARSRLELVVDAAHGTFFERAPAACPIAERIEARMGGDAMEPRAQRGPPVERLERAPRADHPLLHNVLGVDDGPEHSVAVPGEDRAVVFELRVGRACHRREA